MKAETYRKEFSADRRDRGESRKIDEIEMLRFEADFHVSSSILKKVANGHSSLRWICRVSLLLRACRCARCREHSTNLCVLVHVFNFGILDSEENRTTYDVRRAACGLAAGE
jgi:hypothetical protein